MSEGEGYNGWKNRETWNVTLWIENDEGLYRIARGCKDYVEFAEHMRELWEATLPIPEWRLPKSVPATPDGVAWNDSGLDTDALDELIEELREDS